MRENKKFVNYRPMLFIAIALMAGIALSLFVLHNKKAFWYSFVCLCFLCVVLIGAKKYKIVVVAFALLVGFGASYLQYTVNVKNFNDKELCFVKGQVVDVYSYDEYSYIILQRLKIDGFKANGKATLIVENSTNNYKIYEEIELYGYIDNKTENMFDRQTLNEYAQGNYYNIRLWLEVSKQKSRLSFFQKIKNRMITPMAENLTPRNQGVARSLLFGDKRSLDYMDNLVIRATGLSHIFAVSGLHICFVIAIITFLFKKLSMNKWFSLIIMIGVLFVYCGITAFPPSALRASIMAIVYLLSTIVYKKNDALSNLSTAVVVILSVSPATLFSLSFLMSVSAVFGIILFFRPINTFMIAHSKNKFRKFVSGSVALSLSANIFLLPLSINTFGVISVYFVLANLLVLPLVTVTYIALFVSAVFCLFTPWFGFLYLFSNLLISAIRGIASGIALLPFSVIKASSLGVFAIAYVLIMILISRFVILSKYKKLVGVTAILVIGVLFVLIFG